MKCIGQAGQQAENPGKDSLLQLQCKGSLEAEFLLLPEDLKSFSLKAFNYWMSLTHTMEGTLLYSKSTD